MLKPVREDTMFVPNYEDYGRQAINFGAAVYPQMWPAEMAGEGAIYRWHKFLASQHHTMSPNELMHYFKRLLTKEEKDAYWDMFVKALAWLAERCGWKMKNEWAVKEWGAHPIFVTDQPLDDYQPQPPPQDEEITIDMKALANHMGELMPVRFRMRKEIKKWGKPKSRMELQELACAMIAKENNWKEFGNGKFRIV